MKTRTLWTRVLPLAALLLAASPAGAADDVSFKKRGTEEKRFVTAVGGDDENTSHNVP